MGFSGDYRSHSSTKYTCTQHRCSQLSCFNPRARQSNTFTRHAVFQREVLVHYEAEDQVDPVDASQVKISEFDAGEEYSQGTEFGQIAHGGEYDPMHVNFLSCASYFLFLKDDYSHYRRTYSSSSAWLAAGTRNCFGGKLLLIVL